MIFFWIKLYFVINICELSLHPFLVLAPWKSRPFSGISRERPRANSNKLRQLASNYKKTFLHQTYCSLSSRGNVISSSQIMRAGLFIPSRYVRLFFLPKTNCRCFWGKTRLPFNYIVLPLHQLPLFGERICFCPLLTGWNTYFVLKLMNGRVSWVYWLWGEVRRRLPCRPCPRE